MGMKSIEEYQREADGLFYKAIDHERCGNNDEALDIYELIIMKYPGSNSAGMAQVKLNKTKERSAIAVPADAEVPDCEEKPNQWTRERLRELAEKNAADLKKCAEQGGNQYQLSLDQVDEVKKLFAYIEIYERINLLNTYSEEMNAIAASMSENKNKIIAENTRKSLSAAEANVALWQVISLIFTAISFYYLFKAFGN